MLSDRGILQDITDLGFAGVESVHTVQIYWIEGDIHSHAIERICAELLADPVTQNYVYTDFDNRTPIQSDDFVWTIEVRLKRGVTMLLVIVFSRVYVIWEFQMCKPHRQDRSTKYTVAWIKPNLKQLHSSCLRMMLYSYLKSGRSSVLLVGKRLPPPSPLSSERC